MAPDDRGQLFRLSRDDWNHGFAPGLMLVQWDEDRISCNGMSAVRGPAVWRPCHPGSGIALEQSGSAVP
jgi:hypothetical protein